MDSIDNLIKKIEEAPIITQPWDFEGEVDTIEVAVIEKDLLIELIEYIVDEVNDMVDDMEDMIALPTDKDDIAVRVDDRIHLKHNGMDRRVTSLMYAGGGDWIVGCDEGGCFMLPESKDNVTHVTVDTILGGFYKEATEAQYTTDGFLRIVRKYADRLQMRED